MRPGGIRATRTGVPRYVACIGLAQPPAVFLRGDRWCDVALCSVAGWMHLDSYLPTTHEISISFDFGADKSQTHLATSATALLISAQAHHRRTVARTVSVVGVDP